MSADLIGRDLSEVPTPALIVDLDRLEGNIAEMARRASSWGVSYRPHCKSHKAAFVAAAQLAAGAHGLCCAKLSEAEAMAEVGISNILVTSPVVGTAKIRRLAALAGSAELSVVADDESVLLSTAAECERLNTKLKVLIEVNVGQDRCGIDDPNKALSLFRVIEKSTAIEFRGLQGYQGKLQLERDYLKRRDGAKQALDRLLTICQGLRDRGIVIDVLTGGGTGSAAIDAELGGLTELQPGSYVYMDARYMEISWGGPSDPPPFRPALSILASVISRSSRRSAILDCGWKAASCDSGVPVVMEPEGARFAFAGDEHGILQFDGSSSPLNIGDMVKLIPSHCDTTVNLYDRCVGVRNGVVEIIWPVQARGKTQ